MTDDPWGWEAPAFLESVAESAAIHFGYLPAISLHDGWLFSAYTRRHSLSCWCGQNQNPIHCELQGCRGIEGMVGTEKS